MSSTQIKIQTFGHINDVNEFLADGTKDYCDLKILSNNNLVLVYKEETEIKSDVDKTSQYMSNPHNPTPIEIEHTVQTSDDEVPVGATNDNPIPTGEVQDGVIDKTPDTVPDQQ